VNKGAPGVRGLSTPSARAGQVPFARHRRFPLSSARPIRKPFGPSSIASAGLRLRFSYFGGDDAPAHNPHFHNPRLGHGAPRRSPMLARVNREPLIKVHKNIRKFISVSRGLYYVPRIQLE
jgi:hypothetical protein